MTHMKIREIVSVVFLTCTFYSCGHNDTPLNEKEARDEIKRLQDYYYRNSGNEKYELCLSELNEILDLCNKFNLEQEMITEFTDNKHFTLMNLGRYEESLRVALEMEEMSRQSGDTLKPWYYLKIADSYNGIHEYGKSIEWIARAVDEKNFKNYKIFSKPKYDQLQAESTFQSLVKQMKSMIGLDMPA